MGHAIGYRNYKPTKEGTVPIEKMLKDAQEFASINVDRLEDPDGRYHGNFGELMPFVLANEIAAAEYLKGQCGDYRDGYVAYRGKPTKQEPEGRLLYMAKFEVHT